METYIYKNFINRSGVEQEFGRKLTETEWTDFLAKYEEELDAAGEAIFTNLLKQLPAEIW